MNTQQIKRFLEENSDIIPANIPMAQTVQVTRKTQRRPDKVFGATAQMKWDMILAGVDSPYMLNNGRVVAIADASALNSELAELKEFAI